MDNINEISKKDKDDFEYKRLWEYFKYHAEQRIQTFKFYFIMQSVILSGFITFFFKNITVKTPKMGLMAQPISEVSTYIIIPHSTLALIIFGLGLLLILFSIIFWGLDERNRTMIDISRNMLIKKESEEDLKYKIFTKVKKDSEIHHSFKYSFWFKAIFITFIIIGLLIAIFGLQQLIC